MFEHARTVLLGGVWLIEHGAGNLRIQPFVYATGHWRCIFRTPRPGAQTVFRYTIADGPRYLRLLGDLPFPEDGSPEQLGKSIWNALPAGQQFACTAAVTPEISLWIGQLRNALDAGLIPSAFDEYDDWGDRWKLSGGAVPSFMPAMPE